MCEPTTITVHSANQTSQPQTLMEVLNLSLAITSCLTLRSKIAIKSPVQLSVSEKSTKSTTPQPIKIIVTPKANSNAAQAHKVEALSRICITSRRQQSSRVTITTSRDRCHPILLAAQERVTTKAVEQYRTVIATTGRCLLASKELTTKCFIAQLKMLQAQEAMGVRNIIVTRMETMLGTI